MRIVVIGCGKIGKTIISSLVGEGHDVTAVDISAEKLTSVNDMFDVISVCGNATDYDVLTEAGVKQSDLVIATTSSDELNMIICRIVKEMGAPKSIARIRDTIYSKETISFLKKSFDISMTINPDKVTADEIYHMIRFPSALNVHTFSVRDFHVIEYLLKEDSPLVGMKLSELREKFPMRFLVGVVFRDKNIYVPDGEFILQAGDSIAIASNTDEINKLLKAFGDSRRTIKNIMILGGSRIGAYLAAKLSKNGFNVKIIDNNMKTCESLSESLDNVSVIFGDGAKHELLGQEGLDNMDVFVSLTGMDEENMLISYFAKSNNVPKVITKINKGELLSIASEMDLDNVVSPTLLVNDVIVGYARALNQSKGSNMETLYSIMDNKVEIAEFTVSDKFNYLDIPIKEINLIKDILIIGILRGANIIIPTGSDVIQKDDKVIVLSPNKKLSNLSDIVK